MKIIDCHAHIFPEKIAEKASKGIGKFYDCQMRYVGSCERLLHSGEAIGVSKYWVHSVATTAAQVRSINSFIAEQCSIHPEFVGFGTIHPDVEDIGAEIEYIRQLGLHGVKIHPDFQRFRIDEPRALPIYECIAGDLPIIVHTGDYRYDYSSPKRMAHVLEMFPKLECVAAHFGGWSVWEEAYEYLGKTNCWVDTSSTLGFLDDDAVLRRLVSCWGTDRMLFGSDFPMWDHAEEWDRFNKRLGITGDDLEKVLYRNAESIIKTE